jgi:hypothetical protein
MTGNIWIDPQMSLQKLRPRYPTYLTSYPAYLPWVMQWANVALRERSTMQSTGVRLTPGGEASVSRVNGFR